MRTIKFRGREIKTSEWKYGDLMQLNDGSIRIGVQSKTWTDDGYHNNDYENEFEVDEKTIGQFTGLTDKNGKEIYEGDILCIREYDNELMCVLNDDPNRFDLFTLDEIRGKLRKVYITPVTFEEGCFCFSSEHSNQNDMLLCCLFGDMRRSSPIMYFEVIGNIHDNPEYYVDCEEYTE